MEKSPEHSEGPRVLPSSKLQIPLFSLPPA